MKVTELLNDDGSWTEEAEKSTRPMFGLVMESDGSWRGYTPKEQKLIADLMEGKADTTIGGQMAELPVSAEVQDLIDEGGEVQKKLMKSPVWRDAVVERVIDLMGYKAPECPPQWDWPTLPDARNLRYDGSPFHVDYDPKLASNAGATAVGPAIPLGHAEAFPNWTPVPRPTLGPRRDSSLDLNMNKPVPLSSIQDSGNRTQFATGSQRDTQADKGRPSLIPTLVLRRLAKWFGLGASKYAERNWELGQPLSQYYDSAMRHAQRALDGATDEDHEAAWLWNAQAFMWTRHMIEIGCLPQELDDRPRYGERLLAQIDGYDA